MVYQQSVARDSKVKKIENINAFSSLPRNGLEFGSIERMLLLHTTESGEKIYIQYPGKETKAANPDKIRPWDFRPKAELPDGTPIKDLSFSDIWDDISQMHAADKNALSAFAAILFEMAFMTGHTRVCERYPYFDISMETGTCVSEGTLVLQWQKPLFAAGPIKELEKAIGKIRGLSLEAYLLYNDLLAQNEDCKYYYREEVLKRQKWDGISGRRNTLLSHLSVIAYLQGYITFSKIMERFQKGYGVAPCKIAEVPDITNNLVTIV